MNDLFKPAPPVPQHQMVIAALQIELYKRDQKIDELNQLIKSQRSRIKSQKKLSNVLLEY